MTVSQSTFRDAVLNADLPVPAGLRDGQDAPAGTRFSVYRNNVVLSLTEAMATAFPLVHKLLGGETFQKLAAVYVRAHPPRSPLMMYYGADFPDFLQNFAPLSHIGYLPDCARIDLAKRQSYHAADSTPFDQSILLGDDVHALTIAVSPATRIIRSVWPLYDLWRFNTQNGAPKPQAVSQDVLITRPAFDPEVHLLPAGCATWLEVLAADMPLGNAIEKATLSDPQFDLTEALTLAVTSGAFAHENTKDPA